MINEKNPLKLTWREVFDASKIPSNLWGDVVWIASPTGYKYIAYNGIVYNLDYVEICSVYDLVPR